MFRTRRLYGSVGRHARRSRLPRAGELREALRLLVVAVGFLTRIPVPRMDLGAADLRNVSAFFPLVGLLVAGVGVAARAATEPIWGAGVATVAAIAAMILVTGAFHEDGLADTADGLRGAWDPQARLAIMRDSRIGTYGTIALIVVIALRAGLLLPLGLADFARAVACGHVLGRASTLLLSHLLPASSPPTRPLPTARPLPAESFAAPAEPLPAATDPLGAARPLPAEPLSAAGPLPAELHPADRRAADPVSSASPPPAGLLSSGGTADCGGSPATGAIAGGGGPSGAPGAGRFAGGGGSPTAEAFAGGGGPSGAPGGGRFAGGRGPSAAPGEAKGLEGEALRRGRVWLSASVVGPIGVWGVTAAGVVVATTVGLAARAWAPIPLAAGLVVCLGCARLFRRRLGGVTGDALGAANQVIDLAAVAAVAALVRAGLL